MPILIKPRGRAGIRSGSPNGYFNLSPWCGLVRLIFAKTNGYIFHNGQI